MLAPPVMTIQGVVVVAVHAHKLPVMTETLPKMPAGVTETVVGDTL
jgi:hypothetical protein